MAIPYEISTALNPMGQLFVNAYLFKESLKSQIPCIKFLTNPK